jgi:hypothetical protein
MSKTTVQNGKGSSRRSKEDKLAIARNWPKSMLSPLDRKLQEQAKNASQPVDSNT